MNIGSYLPRTRFVLDFRGLQQPQPSTPTLDQPSDADLNGTAKWEDSESKPPATAGEVVVEQIVAATRWAGPPVTNGVMGPRKTHE